jgi:uncharacterized protein
MIIDTSGIRDGHSTLRQNAELESVRENLPSFSEPVICVVEIERHDAVIVAELRFSGSFELQCDRCLEAYPHPVAGEIRLVLQEADGKSGPAPDNETADYYYNSQDFLVDVSPSIYDEIMTSLPLKALCSENCKGIAVESKSGAPAEAVPGAAAVDPRWEALRKLQQK